MKTLPQEVSDAWKKRKGPIVFTTVDKQHQPNAIYATCVSKYDEQRLLVADNFFGKTRQNIFNGSKGSILFITDDNTSYQAKGSIEYHNKGDIFDDMKKWNPEKLPGHAVAILKVEEVYSRSKRLV
ncbi:MAG: pyridoxamine 5'-phosphate oxidase family protein [Candidatus Marinimicrobia bacterium]|nr:pyridoxamine 5'-phosphate oxidase family protein [Candidatus Neomarinimicrobiota bacterium]